MINLQLGLFMRTNANSSYNTKPNQWVSTMQAICIKSQLWLCNVISVRASLFYDPWSWVVPELTNWGGCVTMYCASTSSLVSVTDDISIFSILHCHQFSVILKCIYGPFHIKIQIHLFFVVGMYANIESHVRYGLNRKNQC